MRWKFGSTWMKSTRDICGFLLNLSCLFISSWLAPSVCLESRKTAHYLQMASMGASPQSLSNHPPSHLHPGTWCPSIELHRCLHIPQTFSLSHSRFFSCPHLRLWRQTAGLHLIFVGSSVAMNECKSAGQEPIGTFARTLSKSLSVFVLQILTHSFIYSIMTSNSSRKEKVDL